MDVGLLRMADVCAYSVARVPSKIRQSSAGVGLFAARTNQKSDVLES